MTARMHSARPSAGLASEQGTVQQVGSATVSVIVVNWNVQELLHACLTSLLRENRLPHGKLEVFVVDNASSDGSVEMVQREFPSVHLIANRDNVGFGKANNQALPLCTGKYVLLLNPDTEILDGAVDRMVERMDQSPGIGALACRLLNSDGTFQRWTAGSFPSARAAAAHAVFADRWLPGRSDRKSLFLSRDVDHDVDVDWVSGACMLLRREAVGDFIFDERFFMYGEDTDLCERLWNSGWRVTYAPCANVIHHAGRSMQQQTGDILLTSFKGPRQFYIQRNGSGTVWLYDASMAAAFLVRAAGYSILALLRPRSGYGARVMHSLSYFRRATQVLLGN